MTDRPAPERLAAVHRVRAVQRDWIAATRGSVAEGGPFAICNGDEAEEIFLALGIPVLAINYWNFLIIAQQNQAHFTQVLNERGYGGRHMFALGLASSLAPGKAPWGGLPRPTIICGSSRSETELRVTELWARATGAHFFPMDFSFPAEQFEPLPDAWWTWTRECWADLVKPERLDHRVTQEAQLIAFLETVTGRRFATADLLRAMELVNEQMAHWARARRAIAGAAICPVSARDQMSMYQAMWHRGTATGVSLVRDYADEVEARVAQGTGGYRRERFRIHYSGDVPPWAGWAEETHGAVTVSNFYSGVPDLYARTVHDGDPLRALAGRHLFLFGIDPRFAAYQASKHRCDAMIVVEPYRDRAPAVRSAEQIAAEAAGLRYLAVPRHADDADIRARLDRFFMELD